MKKIKFYYGHFFINHSKSSSLKTFSEIKFSDKLIIFVLKLITRFMLTINIFVYKCKNMQFFLHFDYITLSFIDLKV